MLFGSLLAALEGIHDPRRPQGQRYSLSHLLLFSVLAVLAGATSYQKIITFMAAQSDRPRCLGLVFDERRAVHAARAASGARRGTRSRGRLPPSCGR